MFEMGLSLTAQQGQMSPSSDPYLGGTPEQKDDRLWLQLIHDSDVLNEIGRDLSSQSLCDQLVCRVNSLAKTRCSGDNQFAEMMVDSAIEPKKKEIEDTIKKNADRAKRRKKKE